jgi:cell division protein FtsB
MMARKKIVPPVTPRIVQDPPGQRLFRYVLLFCAFLLAVWFSYDYGRKQAPANGKAAVVQSGESEQRIAELEQERDALKQQATELEQRMKQANRALKAEQARTQAPQQAQSSQRAAPVLIPEPEPATIESDPADNTLRLENVRIEQTESENMYRIGFSVMHRQYVKMGFDQQQDVMEEVVLPDDFRPKNILIEAKPYGDKYTGASEKITWITTR